MSTLVIRRGPAEAGLAAPSRPGRGLFASDFGRDNTHGEKSHILYLFLPLKHWKHVKTVRELGYDDLRRPSYWRGMSQCPCAAILTLARCWPTGLVRHFITLLGFVLVY